ncbi:MAG: GNAT family N-acetyltransferase [Acidobacteriota bacterium]
MNVEFNEVKSAPVEDIVALYRSAGWWKESPEARSIIPDMIRGSFCFMVVRSAEGKTIGMGRVISDGFSDAYIQDVVVLEDHRGNGIGRELIGRLTKVCQEKKIGWIGLVAEPGTQELYEKIGYRPLKGYQPMLYGQQ